MSLIKHKLAKVVLPIPVPLNGLLMLGPCLQIVKNQRHEPEITEFLRNSTNKQTIFCDVGAAYGFHTLMMAREMKKVSKKVWAFEPSHKDRRLLLANLKLNNLNNYVNVEKYFVSDESNATIKFNLETHSGNIFIDGYSENIIEVPQITLDDYGVDFNLVKIDAEGFDLNVLQGAKSLIARGCKFTVEIGMKFSKKPLGDTLLAIRSLGLDLRELPYASRAMLDEEIIEKSIKASHINIAAIPIY